MAFMELIIFAQSRRDNLFQVKSHQVQNFLDSHSKRKSAAGFGARRAEGMRDPDYSGCSRARRGEHRVRGRRSPRRTPLQRVQVSP